MTHTFWSADITRHRDMIVSGLEGEETSADLGWNGHRDGLKEPSPGGRSGQDL